ncbi:hypothetical protein [Kribbella ginsengisoli]|uniref:Uncharacterized protein n=1 Tax=Kribbella ginsengisoli TaxID=363865 RepID=A0ABP6Y8B5_9ACTN
MFDDVSLIDFHARFRVESPKGPYVGYGVLDVQSGHFLTEVDLQAELALVVAARLMVAAAPKDWRHANRIRAVLPPRVVRLASQSGQLGIWAASPSGWLGFVLLDGEMRARWVPAGELVQEEMPPPPAGDEAEVP